ncbi:MAG TPA: carboxypeptidase-like regulatory domain-containing protein [Bacteroidales bacterium]|nr:carboxypeptidase-like regulatory domain-containing protein [Bacteroidales bacterium]
MATKTLLYVLLLTLLVHVDGFSQNADPNKRLIQFSGVVVTADSLNPVSFATILIKNSRRGTITDYYGYFSFVAMKSDTVQFSAIGFKGSYYVIPDSISRDRYSLIHVMDADTILLEPTIIYPWPTVEDFKEAFVNLDIPDDDLEIARKNLDRAEMRYRVESYKMDGSLNYKNYIGRETSKLYYIGQTQPISVMNPFAWAAFIKAWKEGKFKKQKDDKY